MKKQSLKETLKRIGGGHLLNEGSVDKAITKIGGGGKEVPKSYSGVKSFDDGDYAPIDQFNIDELIDDVDEWAEGQDDISFITDPKTGTGGYYKKIPTDVKTSDSGKIVTKGKFDH